MNTVEALARGKVIEVDPVGNNYKDAFEQAKGIINHSTMLSSGVLVALITEIQLKDKQIEMLEYTQSWRMRRL